MDGVIILNSYEYLTNFGSIFVMSILCVWSFAAAVVILLPLLKYGCDSWKKPAFLVICVVLTIVCGCLIPEDKYETRYQVTVDDSVSMNEFKISMKLLKWKAKFIL